MKKIYILSLVIFGVLFAENLQAQTVTPVSYYPMLNWDTSPYQSLRYTRPNSSWDWLNFRLLFPKDYDSLSEDGKKYPMVIMLHGGGESGKMLWNNSTKTNSPYPAGDPRIDNNDHQLLFGGREHLTAANTGRFPGFVMFPQNFYGTWINGSGEASSSIRPDMAKLLELIDYMITELKIDPDRIYIHGLSNGAGGTWYAAYSRPDLFAAALPMSHRGDPAMAVQLSEVPLWVFQGADDTNPRPRFTEETVAAIRNAGGNVRYTKYENTGHNTWNGRAYSEPDFFEWMLGQKKGDPGNISPVVYAGPDTTLQLPLDSLAIIASAQDPDGSIDAYHWVKLSGPDISYPNNASHILNLKNLVEGEYEFQVTVTDDEGATASDRVNITVLADPDQNKLPVVNAGPDRSITLPLDSLSFLAIAADEDGEIVGYLWEKLSGPAVDMAGESTEKLELSGLQPGSYLFAVTVTDDRGDTATDQVSLLVKEGDPDNKVPVANAGSDKTLTLPTNTINLYGSATDEDGRFVAFKWEKMSGPTATMTGHNTANLKLTDLVEGVYVFRFSATDDGGAIGYDDMTLTVINPDTAENQRPLVNAGSDQTIKLPTDTASLTALAYDEDGEITSFLWEKLEGPEVTMSGTGAETLRLSALVEGSYVFKVTVTDDAGATASDEVGLVVEAAEQGENQLPLVNAGSDQTIKLPTDTTSFTALAYDEDGDITSFLWEKLEGPEVTMSGTAAETLRLSALVEGSYIFKVSVTDDAGATASDEVGLVVEAAEPGENQRPLVNAGSGQTIKLPTDTTSFTALAYDEDGEIASFLWEKLEGPEVTMNGTAAETLTLSALVEGSYVFRVTVTDDAGATASDEVGLVVEPAQPELKVPVANAGSDKTLTLPTNAINLSGWATGGNGRFVAFKWEKINGPAVTMAGQNSANVKLTDLVEGEYVFRFSATDNMGVTGYDEVKVTVVNPDAPVNKAPTVNAGADQTIDLPVSTTTITASATDEDGEITGYNWVQFSGPAINLSGASTAVLEVSGLIEGSYEFRVTVTDNDGATATDNVRLIVRASVPENQVPVANAGSDKTLTLPNNAINLSGRATDADGRFVAFKWEKVSGPSVTMASQNTANVKLSNLVEGVYVFRFSATDNGGATGSDEMTLIVLGGNTNAMAKSSNTVAPVFSVYPNTFDWEVNLEIQAVEGETFEVKVFSFLGKLIYQGQVSLNELNSAVHQIDLGGMNLASGTYLLQVQNKKSGIKEVIRILKR